VSKPIFRNPDKFQVLPWRDLLRDLLPPGREGIVVEDLDLVICRFGKREGRAYSDDGKFLLMEVKYQNFRPNYAQRKVFGLIDRLLKKADPEKKHYIGYYVLHWWDDDHVKIDNGSDMTKEQLKEWLLTVK